MKQDVTVESTDLALKNSGDNVTLSPNSSFVVNPSSMTNDNRVYENSIVMDDQQQHKEVNEIVADQAEEATSSTALMTAAATAASSHEKTNTSNSNNSSSCTSSNMRKAEGSDATNVTQITIGKLNNNYNCQNDRYKFIPPIF